MKRDFPLAIFQISLVYNSIFDVNTDAQLEGHILNQLNAYNLNYGLKAWLLKAKLNRSHT